MIHNIASMFLPYLDTLPFKDQVAGIVKVIERKEGERGTKRFPAAYQLTEKSVNEESHESLVPDSAKKSILYFEDGGIRFIEFKQNNFYFEATLTLIGWLNTQRTKDTGGYFPYSSAQAISIAYILGAIPEKLPNTMIDDRLRYHTITAQVSRILETSAQLFSKYTYDEKIRPYLVYPYCAFGIEWKVRFALNKNCLPTVEQPLVGEYNYDYNEDYTSPS